jgi:hypothetical protein
VSSVGPDQISFFSSSSSSSSPVEGESAWLSPKKSLELLYTTA